MPKVASHRGSILRWLVLAGVLAGAVGFVAVLLRMPDRAFASTTPPPTEPEDLGFSPMQVPPMRTPDTLPPADSNVRPDDLVVGVSVGGVQRAYLLKAFDEVSSHVLNDLLAGQPITVTHCPDGQCTRVFTGAPGGRLQMRVAGWADNTEGYRMVLRVGRGEYHQETGRSVRGGGSIPHPTVAHELTTWGEWRAKYPNSDLYSGGAEIGY